MILLFSTVVDYYLAGQIHRSDHEPKRKLLLICSLVINLGLLGFFKYSYYFADTLNGIFGTDLKAVNFFHVFSNNFFHTDFKVSEIFLPVGISFFTFQTLSYTIDVYRRRLEPAKNILDFGFFVTFFPQLVAGPIVRASDFLPQIAEKFRLTKREFSHAIFLILGGLIKKTIISDYISVNFVDRVFDDPQLYSGFDNLMAVYGYAIQIYCDFSGYSDMAIGLALLMGFRLPLNFDSPYISTSITEFWRRWHISLSSWLKDYLYISLGGNRKGKIRTYINLMLTMLLGGLWHGAANKFIIWGALHGVALAVHKIWNEKVKKVRFTEHKAYNLIAGVLTFHFVCFCWIYFRADDVATVKLMLQRMFEAFSVSDIVLKIQSYYKVFSLILIGFVLHFVPRAIKNRIEDQFARLPLFIKIIIIVMVVLVTYQAASSNVQPFIYFQF